MSQFNFNSVNTLHIHNTKPSHPYFEVKPHSQLDRADAITAYLDGTIGIIQELIGNEEHRELHSLLHLVTLNLDTVRDMLSSPLVK